MTTRIIVAIVWVIERVPFLRRWILRQSSQKDDDINPNIYKLH